ncbi:unnamed protein product [Albugo candida]|uniref:Chromo domain-containing protein n=1 Tax=Albugo candida TaxID=65357 RepID=A0A024GUT4_9STRA|nr:unnamed protein product [Albugo candida]|eukprot:CCI50753.1 unnamed protein product [Albugo candida]
MVADKFCGYCFLRASARYELLVFWRGLSRAEDSWETAAALHRDVPILVKKYCLLHQADQLVIKMAKRLGITNPEGGTASQLAARGSQAQACEPLKNPALTSAKASEQQPG